MDASVILSNILTQFIYFVLNIFIIGFVISILNRIFYKTVNYNRAVCYATGVIGTPIHELSHALMCIVFFHRITEIKLFQIDEASGTLGYVNHSYNPRKIYQRIGNYFIGIAPIIGGTLVVYLLMRWLAPYAHSEMCAYLSDFAMLQNRDFSMNWFSYAAVVFWGSLKAVFVSATDGFTWYIFFILAFCIALHMNLSAADIKGSISGVIFFIILLFGLNFFIGGIFRSAYPGFCTFMNSVGAQLTGTLLLSLVLSVVCVAVGFAVKGISILIGIIKRKRA